MTNHLMHPASCGNCGFTTTDVHLLSAHSCDVTSNGGRCEDFPCCGHEAGDCNGLLYGSDEAIKSDPHLLCDHNTGGCEVEDRMTEEDNMTEQDWEEMGSAMTDSACQAEADLYDSYGREAEEAMLGRPLFPNEY